MADRAFDRRQHDRIQFDEPVTVKVYSWALNPSDQSFILGNLLRTIDTWAKLVNRETVINLLSQEDRETVFLTVETPGTLHVRWIEGLASVNPLAIRVTSSLGTDQTPDRVVVLPRRRGLIIVLKPQEFSAP